MKLTEKELEEVLTIAEQCKCLMPKLKYNEELSKRLVIDCMKDNKPLTEDMITQLHNNYLALALIGLNYSNSSAFKKLNKYMEENK